eukprot:UN11421
MNATEHISVACVELAVRYVSNAWNNQQKNAPQGKDIKNVKNGHDFSFETLDRRNNSLPFELFEDEKCLLQLPSNWFAEFDDLLSLELLNKICNAIVDAADTDNNKINKSKVDRNPMYVGKHLLKQTRKT